ncbi:MAG TPA: phospholipase D-like domain-containing protein [Steroidobacteraceae bacterium]|nr:phospholipase D-like domain-containing protein [Steroidobacteraceae bacterium]
MAHLIWMIAAAVVTTLIAVVVLINFHTPEKKVQHQVHHLYGVLDPQFEREMGTLLGPAILPGNQVTALQNGDQIFPAMLKAIRAAQYTINFETYIYWSGRTGEEFAEALIERVRADVKIHLMLDWLGSQKMAPQLVERMQDAGVEIERYHALHWYSLGKLNNRTHRKVLIVDGRIGFTGGVGIADQWTGHAEDPDHWRDMHFRIEGPVVAQFQAAFLDNWIKTTGRVLNGDTYFPTLTPVAGIKMHMFMSSPAGGSESMRLMYLMAITAAQRSIDIEAAYFIPDALMSRELIRARERGVRIRLLLPDKHIDSETVRIASKRAWGSLLEQGVEIHMYEPTMLHCKMLIFDQYMVSVGSTNFDMRSFELNDEASLNIYDSAFAQRMTEVFEADLKASTSYDFSRWKNRPLSEKMAEVVLIPIKSQL